MRGLDCLARGAAASADVIFRQRASSARLAAMRGTGCFDGNVRAGAVRNRTGSRRLHGQGMRLRGSRVGHCMRGAGLRSRRRDGVADRERCRRCPGLRRRAPAGLAALPCVRPVAWPSPLSSPVSRVRAAAWRTWFVVEPCRHFSGSLQERQTAALSRLRHPGRWALQAFVWVVTLPPPEYPRKPAPTYPRTPHAVIPANAHAVIPAKAPLSSFPRKRESIDSYENPPCFHPCEQTP